MKTVQRYPLVEDVASGRNYARVGAESIKKSLHRLLSFAVNVKPL